MMVTKSRFQGLLQSKLANPESEARLRLLFTLGKLLIFQVVNYTEDNLRVKIK